MATSYTAGLLHKGFGNQSFEIVCNSHEAYRLIEFLFIDFPEVEVEQEPKHYDLIYSGSRPMISLWEGEKRLYFGQNPYHLAVILMNFSITASMPIRTATHCTLVR